MKEKVYFVMREKRVWKYVEELKMHCWVTISRKKVSTNRLGISEANKDFEMLGFEIKSGPGVMAQCHDNIVPNKYWVRYIVQCRNIKLC